MITKLIFKSNNSDIQIQNGVCMVQTESQSSLVQFKRTDNRITFRFKQKTLIQKFSQVLSTISAQETQSTKLLSIDGIIPDQRNGAFYVLGSQCVSIGDFTDTSDPSISSGLSTLTVFDGCVPCNFCPKLAQLKRDLRECQIYLNYLKDCNLYYMDQAWDRLQRSISQGREQTAGCTTRPIQFSQIQPAIKLLYQYKAVVLMWNYLVSIYRGNLQILQAVQDWGGFIIQSKRSADLCAVNSEIQVSFQIFVKLQQGQTAEYLQALHCGMGFYIDIVPQNTYIQYGKDSGMHSKQGFDNSHITAEIHVPARDDEGQIHAKVTFTTNTPAVTVFAASIKILPVIYLLDYKYYNVDPQTGEKTTVRLQTPAQSPLLIGTDGNIFQWNKYRVEAQELSDSSYVDLNLWRISTNWDLRAIQPTSGQNRETLYYNTAYIRYAQPQSDSITQQQDEVQ